MESRSHNDASNMLSRIKRVIKSRARNLAREASEGLIKTFDLDTKHLFYKQYGILKYKDSESGEAWFIKTILRDLLSDVKSPVLIDIGANIGNYSLALAEVFHAGRIYACEPNPATFSELCLNTRHFSSIKPINYGAGSKQADLELFIYKDSPQTSHASLHRQVFSDLHHESANNIDSLFCKIDRLDHLLDSGIIPESEIHFIKIDTEGHELEGLRGSIDTIQNRGVRAIQFEFNEMNVVSRVFLKDFYGLLGEGWRFFRLDSQRLIDLGRYDSSNEIFKFQNIIAVRRGAFLKNAQ